MRGGGESHCPCPTGSSDCRRSRGIQRHGGGQHPHRTPRRHVHCQQPQGDSTIIVLSDRYIQRGYLNEVSSFFCCLSPARIDTNIKRYIWCMRSTGHSSDWGENAEPRTRWLRAELVRGCSFIFLGGTVTRVRCTEQDSLQRYISR